MLYLEGYFKPELKHISYFKRQIAILVHLLELQRGPIDILRLYLVSSVQMPALVPRIEEGRRSSMRRLKTSLRLPVTKKRAYSHL